MTSLKAILAAASLLISTHTLAVTAFGDWQNIDDKTGQKQAIITMSKNENGEMVGVVKTLLVNQELRCEKCTDARKDQPVSGMEIIWGLTPSGDNKWSGGTVLNPITGKTYNLTAQLSDDGKHLTLHAYLGLPLLGRTQIWDRL